MFLPPAPVLVPVLLHLLALLLVPVPPQVRDPALALVLDPVQAPLLLPQLAQVDLQVAPHLDLPLPVHLTFLLPVHLLAQLTCPLLSQPPVTTSVRMPGPLVPPPVPLMEVQPLPPVSV